MYEYEEVSMPANFTEEEKNIITQNLYKKGYILLKKYGMKKMKISELAKSCNIGTGTFYNFFSGKEHFIIKLIEKRKNESFDSFNLLAKKHPNGIPFDEIYLYFFNNLLNNNVYRLLTQEEYNSIIQKIPTQDNTEEIAKYMMSKLDSDKGVQDFLLFAECYKIIIIGSSDLSKLNNTILNDALSSMVKSACKLLY